MRLSTPNLSTLGIACAALVASFASANALQAVRPGILQCQGGQSVGFVVGSVTSAAGSCQGEAGRRGAEFELGDAPGEAQDLPSTVQGWRREDTLPEIPDLQLCDMTKADGPQDSSGAVSA